MTAPGETGIAWEPEQPWLCVGLSQAAAEPKRPLPAGSCSQLPDPAASLPTAAPDTPALGPPQPPGLHGEKGWGLPWVPAPCPSLPRRDGLRLGEGRSWKLSPCSRSGSEEGAQAPPSPRCPKPAGLDPCNGREESGLPGHWQGAGRLPWIPARWPRAVGSLQPAGGTSGAGRTPLPRVVAGSLLQGHGAFQHHSGKGARVSAQLCQPQGSTAAPRVSQD